jgi:hypothetical protein
MISRRFFSRLPAAAAASAVAGNAAGTETEDSVSRRRSDPVRENIQGSWNTLMTFSAAPPAPLPQSFWIYETFMAEGEYISIAALPFTTSAHGSWALTDNGLSVKTRSRLIVLPQVLGVGVKVEITELITLEWGRYTYGGTFSAVFTPEKGDPFTLTGKPAGSRIPDA